MSKPSKLILEMTPEQQAQVDGKFREALRTDSERGERSGLIGQPVVADGVLEIAYVTHKWANVFAALIKIMNAEEGAAK